MYSRGKSINPEKQEKLDNMAKQFAAGGKKKWVRYDEGALLYSMGIHSFMELAKEAKAVYHIKRIVLVNTEKLDEYIEVMYSDDPCKFQPLSTTCTEKQLHFHGDSAPLSRA